MKVNLGCGPKRTHREGYLNCDININARPQKFVDVKEPLPWEDNSLDEVRCENLFDSLTRVEFNNLLREIHRVLKPGALLTFHQMDISVNPNDGIGWPCFVCGVTRKLFDYYEVGHPAHETWKKHYNLPGFTDFDTVHNDAGVMIGSMRKPRA